MPEIAKFVCFNYMQRQNVKFKSVQINMKHVSYKLSKRKKVQFGLIEIFCISRSKTYLSVHFLNL